MLGGGSEEPEPNGLTPAATEMREAAETPRLQTVEPIEVENGVWAVMRGEFDNGRWLIGMATGCQDAEPVVQLSLGPFPADERAVQLAVRTPAGHVERFGPILRAGPEAGFHGPEVRGTEAVGRFTDSALISGALISNGFHSFFNVGDEETQRSLLSALEACF